MGFLDVLGVQRETAHTKLLAWLLDPNEDHGLGQAVLRAFCKDVLGTVPNLTSATVATERPELLSRGDITIQTAKHYIVVENKINHEAFKADQLTAHARGALHRCRDNDREPWVVLVVPDARRKGCPNFPPNFPTSHVARLDWCRIVAILRSTLKTAPPDSQGRAFIPAYIDFIEREILMKWKGFAVDFLDDTAVKAAAIYASKADGIDKAFRDFSAAVNLQLGEVRGSRSSALRGLRPYEGQHQLFSRTWKLDELGKDELFLAGYVNAGAERREQIELWIEMNVNTPAIVSSGTKLGWKTTEAARRAFGKTAYADSDPDNLYVTIRMPKATWMAFSPAKAEKAVTSVADVLMRFWDNYERCAKKATTL